MAFFGIARTARQQRVGRGDVSDAFLRRHECAACPLNGQHKLAHPHMEPTGAAHPLAYFIGEAPGADEDRTGKHFVGPAGRILRHHLLEKWLPDIRWSNAVRTRPLKDRTPTRVEVQCCKPSNDRDVLASDPAAIVGFGNVALSWAGIADSGITLWAGRRVPILVGGKPFWYFPVIHPLSVKRDPQWRGLQRSSGHYGSELEFQMALHLRQALTAIAAGLPEPRVHTPEEAEGGVVWVDGSGGQHDVDRVLDHLRAAGHRKLAGVDYETSSIRPYDDGAKILTAAVWTLQDGALAFPFDHREAGWSRRQREAIGDAWEAFLYDAPCRKVAHNLAFEAEWSAYFYGEDCLRASLWGDSMSQAYVLDERPGAHSLDFLCRQYFGLAIKVLSGVDSKNLDAEPLHRVLRYNGMDAKYHGLLYAEQALALRDAGLMDLYRDHLERVPAAVLTQLKGVPVSQTAVLELGRKYVPRIAEAEQQLRGLGVVTKFERAVGRKFRPSANEDVKKVLAGLGVFPDNVDEEALSAVAHPFAREMVAWRKASKVYGTYVMPTSSEETRTVLEGERRRAVEGVGGEIDARGSDTSQIFSDGMLHPQTNVNRVRTSRTSSDGPNYQNWPKRSAKDAVEVRGIVEPGVDERVVSFDYGQIQARNVGMESLDRALLDAFWNDYDIHHDFMEHLVRIYPRWVKEGVRELNRKDEVGKKLIKAYRNTVKHGFVFAKFFGAGAKKTASVLRVPISATEQLSDIFSERFGGIVDWHGRLERDYYRTGYVTGHAGYRRRAPVSYNERVNSPIQADEAKIVLDAMIRLSKIDHDLLQASLEIHDDLTFVWPAKKVDELSEVVVREMLTVPFAWAKVTPILVERAVGRSWATLKDDLEPFASHRYDGIDMPRECPI